MTQKNPSDMKFNRNSLEAAERLYGVFTARVTDIADPQAQGRVKVMLPDVGEAGDASREVWARLATLMDRHHRGSQLMPDINDEVLVAFEAGDPQRPIIIGRLWNESDRPPDLMNGAETADRYVLQTRKGIKIMLDDTDGQEQLILETPNGQKLMMKDNPDSIEMVDGSGNSIKLEEGGITVNTLAKVTINASLVEVSSGFTQFSGVVQCDTLISNVVVSAVFTPGAGNIW